MKIGNWINISAVLLTAISAQTMAAEPAPKEIKAPTTPSISKEEIRSALIKLQTPQKPTFTKSSPCYSAPTKERN